MQSYADIPDTTTLTASRSMILNNILTALSSSSGTAFPTTNLQVGMLCLRTDLSKLYILTATTPTWTFVCDLAVDQTSTLQAKSGQVGTSTSWDAMTTAGVYVVSSASAFTGAGAPAGAYTFGTLVVFANGNSVSQVYMAHSNGTHYTRTKWNATDWTSWVVPWRSVS